MAHEGLQPPALEQPVVPVAVSTRQPSAASTAGSHRARRLPNEPAAFACGSGFVSPSWNQDPDDQGCVPERLIWLSRYMAWVLRHGARDLGLILDEGWLRVSMMLRHEKFAGITDDDVRLVVKESCSKARPRFELLEEGELWIRATHKQGRAVKPSAPQRALQRAVVAAPSATSAIAYSVAGVPTPCREESPVGRGGVQQWPTWEDAKKNCEQVATGTTQQLSAEDDAGAAAEAVAAQDSQKGETVETALEVTWQKYQSDEGYWWWCEATEDCFVEARPEPWSKFLDPDSGRAYWYNTPSQWFWEHSGRAGPP